VSEHRPKFDLPKDLDHYLAALSKLYARDGERQKHEIIVNSQVRIHEQWTYDDWDGGRYGHALYLTVPETLYLNLVEQRRELQNEITSDINKIHNVRDEFIAEVFLEMEKGEDLDWRRESGLLRLGQRVIAPKAAERIWNADCYKLFLSHKAEVKKKTSELKEQLELYGVSSFVAHQDILPTKEWQDEIENALASMDAFVALLTDNFHNSDWTDQEVGYALGRGVPMIAVKLGKDPYGFIGKFQALGCNWTDAPFSIVKLLIKQPRMLEAYVKAVQNCKSFDQGNALSKLFAYIEGLTNDQTKSLVSAFNENTQLQGSFGFSGSWPSKFGPGLAAYLSHATGTEYVMTSAGQIKVKKR
jgi:hypothetical protein